MNITFFPSSFALSEPVIGPKRKRVSSGRRRRAFRAALRQELLALASEFYRTAGVTIDDTLIHAVANSATRQIEKAVRSNPDFGHKATAPGFQDEDELVTLLLKRLDETGRKGQVFGFAGGQTAQAIQNRAVAEAV